MDVRTINDLVGPNSQAAAAGDELGLERTKRLARQIMVAVSDPKMHHSIPMKAARAVVDGKVDPAELKELLDIIVAKGRTINTPGAYFCSSLKRIFQRCEVPW